MFLKIPIILKCLAHDFSTFERPNTEKEQHTMFSHLLKPMFVGKLRYKVVICLTGTQLYPFIYYSTPELSSYNRDIALKPKIVTICPLNSFTDSLHYLSEVVLNCIF